MPRKEIVRNKPAESTQPSPPQKTEAEIEFEQIIKKIKEDFRTAADDRNLLETAWHLYRWAFEQMNNPASNQTGRSILGHSATLKTALEMLADQQSELRKLDYDQSNIWAAFVAPKELVSTEELNEIPEAPTEKELARKTKQQMADEEFVRYRENLRIINEEENS